MNKRGRNFHYALRIVPVTGLVGVLMYLLPLFEDARARSDPVVPSSASEVAELTANAGKGSAEFSSEPFFGAESEYQVEVPAAWRKEVRIEDRAREVMFVGPVDERRHSVTTLTIGCYRQEGMMPKIEAEMTQLSRTEYPRIINDEAVNVDQRPARRILILDQVAMPAASGEIVQVVFSESFVIIPYAQCLYVLGYVTTPDLYEVYLPVFQRIVDTFQARCQSRE